MSSRLRVMVGAVGLAGHTLPALALARELHRRGHEVRFHGFDRWRETAEGLGLGFAGAERSIAGTSDGKGGDPTLAETVRALLPSIDEFGPHVVVSDGLTLAPALAAEVRGLPRAILLPEVYPVHEPAMPFFSLGLLPPRTALGSAAWRALVPVLATRLPSTRWLRRSREALNEQRLRLGLPPSDSLHGSVGELTLVATMPQLEYAREWPPHVHVTGPMIFDPTHPRVSLPGGDRPLVVVAPSTVKDPDGRLLRVAIEALASEPVRLLVTTSGTAPVLPDPVPANVAIAEWVDYSQVMPGASLVVCHGNHGTVVKALAEGIPVLVSPAMPDDAEHGARVAWAGVGLMLPRPLLSSRSLRATVRRILSDRRFADRADAVAAWSREHDGASIGADLVERHAGGSR